MPTDPADLVTQDAWSGARKNGRLYDVLNWVKREWFFVSLAATMIPVSALLIKLLWWARTQPSWADTFGTAMAGVGLAFMLTTCLGGKYLRKWSERTEVAVGLCLLVFFVLLPILAWVFSWMFLLLLPAASLFALVPRERGAVH